MARPEALNLLKLLKVPTFQADPSTKSVQSYADFFVAIDYTDREFSTFVSTLLTSASQADVTSFGASEEDQAKTRRLLTETIHDMVSTLIARRARRGRFTDNPSRHDPNAGDNKKLNFDKQVDTKFEEIWRDAHTIIGPIVLDGTMPIIDVEITENYSVQSTRTLRSSTDPVFKSHKSDIVLAVTIQVPANRINDNGNVPGLYSLLSTLKMFPVCEIVSSAITPVYVNSILAPEVFDSVRKKVSEELSKAPGNSERRGEQVNKLLSDSFGSSLDSFKRFIGDLNPIVDFAIRSDDMVRNKDGSAAQIPSDPTMSLASERLKNFTSSISVACAYVGCIVKTAQGRTNEFTVKLFFNRFNDKVWSPAGKIFYRDSNGDPTPNATECPWIREISNKVFSNEGYNPTRFMKPYDYFSPDGYSGIEFVWSDPINPDDPYIFKPNGNSFVISDIECRSFMKMVSLPMLGSPYPTAQYLGLDNIHAHITATINDAVELARLHEMKASLDQINYETAPEKRSHFVNVKNNVLNFLGGHSFVISGITTSRSGEDDVWDVEIDLIESSISSEETEAITLRDESYKEKEDIKIIWKHIYKLLSEKSEYEINTFIPKEGTNVYLPDYDKVSSKSYGYKAYRYGITSEGFLNEEGQLAWELVFGQVNNRGSNSLLQPNIMAAAWYSLAVKHSSGEGDRPRFWSTSFRNDPKIAAVLEGNLYGKWSYLNDRTQPRIDITKNEWVSPFDSNGVFVTTLVEPSAGSNVRVTPISLTGYYNPVSIFDVVSSNTIREMGPSSDVDSSAGQNTAVSEQESIAQMRAINWLDKGQYDPDRQKGIWGVSVDNFLFESAQTNIKEQGKEMLEWMSSGDGRRNVFFSEEFWDEYFDIVYEGLVRPDSDQRPAWKNEDILDARIRLASLLREGIYTDFPSLFANGSGNKLETLTAKDRYVRTNLNSEDVNSKDLSRKYEANRSNYADMRLPTYQKVFSLDDKILLEKDSHKELWRKFSPTYSDLGIKPPYIREIAFENISDAINKCARDINDPIEPDCVYYHFRMKGKALAALLDQGELMESQLRSIQSHKQVVVPASISRNGASAVDGFLKEAWKIPSERYMREAFDKRNTHEALRNLGENGGIKSISVIDEEGAYLGTVTPDTNSKQRIKFTPMPGVAPKIYSGDGSTAVDHYSSVEISKIGKDLLLRCDDRTGSMSKIYPAYRLYFIEKDKNFRFLSDDLYGVNSLISLSLRKDKDDADVLIATISNTTDNLSNERVLTQQQTAALGLLPDDEGEPYFSSLKLQSGVLVQLRLGYGSDPDDLPIVFTGMITEIKPGKIVEITCQGHKRELLNEVQFEMESINHFDIVRKLLEKTEHPNLGEPVSAGRATWTSIASKFPQNQNPYDYVGMTDRWYNKKIVDMSNVYLTSNAPLESGRKVYFDDRDGRTGASRIGNGISNTLEFLSSALPDSYWVDLAYTNGRWAKWVIPPQSAWDAIQEVTRHRPGHIAQVVPYDSRGTLFVGQPEQAYQYTEPNHLELMTYSLLQDTVSKQNTLKFKEDLINPFLNSEWAKIYSAHFKGWSVDAQKIKSNGLVFSSFSDSSVFVRPEDVMELDELPDADDKANLFKELADSPETDHLAKAHIASLSRLPQLPANFEIETNWWMYSNSITKEVSDLEKLYPGIIEALFIWFYDLDPTNAKLNFGNLSSTISPMFFEAGGPVMTNFIKELENVSESDFSMPYEDIANGSALSNAIQIISSGNDKQVDILLANGLISQDEASTIRANLFDPTNKDTGNRSLLNDPVMYHLRQGKRTAFRQILAETGGAFRLFVFNMYMFLTKDIFKSDTKKKVDAAKASKSITNLMGSSLPPGKKVFRSYHYITIGDIVENNIVASMDEMSNCCLVRAPASEIEYNLEEGVDGNGEKTEEVIVEFEETDWRSYPSTDGVPYTWRVGKEFRKLGVVYELNAIHPNQKAKTLMSNMGAMLAPMYRGNIVVVGRDIKPHDIVYINDTENDLRGHFEVESVVHHFSVATGWVSDIKPCAFVRVNNPTAEIQLASTHSWLSTLQVVTDVLDVGFTLLAIAGFVFSGPVASVVSTALKTAATSGAKTLASSAGKAAAKNIVAAAVRNYGRAGLSYAAGLAKGAGSQFMTNLGEAGAAAAAVRSNKALAMVKYLGNMVTPRGVSIYMFLKSGVSLASIYTTLSTKHVLASTELPIDIHLLLYRGQVFQAGLGVEDEDLYSIYEKFAGAVSDMKEDFGNFLEGLADDITGVENLSPVERVRRNRDRR